MRGRRATSRIRRAKTVPILCLITWHRASRRSQAVPFSFGSCNSRRTCVGNYGLPVLLYGAREAAAASGVACLLRTCLRAIRALGGAPPDRPYWCGVFYPTRCGILLYFGSRSTKSALGSVQAGAGSGGRRKQRGHPTKASAARPDPRISDAALAVDNCPRPLLC